jgi:hypothetical protein
MSGDAITWLFTIIDSVLPSADLDLYGELHRLMLEMVKSLHSMGDDLLASHVRVTSIGARSGSVDFRACSLHFWATVWVFERDELSVSNSPHFFTCRVVDGLAPIALDLLLLIDVDSNHDFLVFETMLSFAEAILHSGVDCSYAGFFLEVVLRLIAENCWVAHNASLIIMRSLLLFPFVPDFALSQFVFILSCFAAPIPKLSKSAFDLLTPLFNTFPVLCESVPFSDAIFASSAGHMLLELIIIRSTGFVFNFFPQILEIARGDFGTMRALVHCPILALTRFVVEILYDLLQHVDIDFLLLVIHVMHRVGNCVVSQTENIAHFLFSFPEVNFEVMLAFSAFIQSVGRSFCPFSAQFLTYVMAALETPNLVSVSALALADFYRLVGPGEKPGDFYHFICADEARYCTELLFRVLEQSVNSSENPIKVPDTLEALDKIVVTDPLFDSVIRLWNLAITFANTPLDPDSNDDVAYAKLLFTAVTRVITHTIRTADLLSSHMLFTSERLSVEIIAGFELIFARIWETKAFDMASMTAILDLMAAIVIVLGAQAMEVLSMPGPQSLVLWAISSGDDILREAAITLSAWTGRP